MTVMARGVHVDIIILRSVGNEAIDYYALRNKVRGAPNTSVRAPTSVRANTYLEGNKVIPTCNKRVTPFERPSCHVKPSPAFYLHHPRPPRGILHDPRPFGVEVLLHDGLFERLGAVVPSGDLRLARRLGGLLRRLLRAPSRDGIRRARLGNPPERLRRARALQHRPRARRPGKLHVAAGGGFAPSRAQRRQVHRRARTRAFFGF